VAASLAQLKMERAQLRLRMPAWIVRDVLIPFVLTRLILTTIGLFASPGNFLLGVYPHALFLAGALGAVAALARVQGCAIVLPLAFEYLWARGYRLPEVRLDMLSLLLPLGSFGIFAAILCPRACFMNEFAQNVWVA
jgi:hypothetical protein